MIIHEISLLNGYLLYKNVLFLSQRGYHSSSEPTFTFPSIYILPLHENELQTRCRRSSYHFRRLRTRGPGSGS